MPAATPKRFHGVPLKEELSEFTPLDPTPWDLVGVDDLMARQYGQGHPSEASSEPAVDAARRAIDWLHHNLRLDSGANVLDIGCGPGVHSHRLAELGYRVTGTDVNPVFLDFARRRTTEVGLDCRYLRIPMSEMDFDRDFDLVLAVQGPSLQVRETELDAFMAQMARSLRPGGHLLCELSRAPADIGRREPEVTVVEDPTTRLMGRPVRAALLRRLFFPAERERVHHRLFLHEEGDVTEFWSRFFLHDPAGLVTAAEGAGLRVRGVFGPAPGEPVTDGQSTCHLWAVRDARRGTGRGAPA
ncbi:class I SAM-dependent methyltransferase [Streptomyces sp. NPDC048717]|uniref:class I SAM-dependent methyltransferase n=1 Tax=unclassified Streptomyces TaxID=2593676 RepID=UPI003423AC8F